MIANYFKQTPWWPWIVVIPCVSVVAGSFKRLKEALAVLATRVGFIVEPGSPDAVK
jgi:hypothetical protein